MSLSQEPKKYKKHLISCVILIDSCIQSALLTHSPMGRAAVDSSLTGEVKSNVI